MKVSFILSLTDNARLETKERTKRFNRCVRRSSVEHVQLHRLRQHSCKRCKPSSTLRCWKTNRCTARSPLPVAADTHFLQEEIGDHAAYWFPTTRELNFHVFTLEDNEQCRSLPCLSRSYVQIDWSYHFGSFSHCRTPGKRTGPSAHRSRTSVYLKQRVGLQDDILDTLHIRSTTGDLSCTDRHSLRSENRLSTYFSDVSHDEFGADSLARA